MIDSRWKMVPALAGILLLAGCARVEKQPGVARRPDVSEKAARLRVESRGLRELSWQENGKYIMRASAARLTGEEQGKSELKGARLTLYRAGVESARISAGVIRADARARTLTATGGIAVDSATNDTHVTVRSLEWKYREGKIVGEGGVRVSSGLGEVYGDRFTADTGLDKVTLYSSGGGRASLNAAAPK